MLAYILIATAAADPFGFTKGTSPVVLDSRVGQSGWTSADECVDCHADIAAQWQQSRHRVAWTNDLMQAGFVAEPQLFCVNCHAPAREQVAEVQSNLSAYAALGPHAPPHVTAAPLKPEPKAEEGITCVVCHLRDGQMLTAGPGDPDGPHELRVDPEFGTSAACTTCHDFPTPAFVDGVTHFTEEPMQATASEWEDWKALTGRDEGCQTCHMPEGSHAMRGAHDLERVSGAVVVEQRAGQLVLSTKDVGHAVPTGDLFRHLTVEARPAEDQPWTVLATLGRSFEVDTTTVPPLKRQIADTRLHPNAPQIVTIPKHFQGGSWRVQYHYGGPHDEVRALVSMDQLVRVVDHGALSFPPSSVGH